MKFLRSIYVFIFLLTTCLLIGFTNTSTTEYLVNNSYYNEKGDEIVNETITLPSHVQENTSYTIHQSTDDTKRGPHARSNTNQPRFLEGLNILNRIAQSHFNKKKHERKLKGEDETNLYVDYNITTDGVINDNIELSPLIPEENRAPIPYYHDSLSKKDWRKSKHKDEYDYVSFDLPEKKRINVIGCLNLCLDLEEEFNLQNKLFKRSDIEEKVFRSLYSDYIMDLKAREGSSLEQRLMWYIERADKCFGDDKERYPAFSTGVTENLVNALNILLEFVQTDEGFTDAENIQAFLNASSITLPETNNERKFVNDATTIE